MSNAIVGATHVPTKPKFIKIICWTFILLLKHREYNLKRNLTNMGIYQEHENLYENKKKLKHSENGL